jgi:hypothetical protein
MASNLAFVHLHQWFMPPPLPVVLAWHKTPRGDELLKCQDQPRVARSDFNQSYPTGRARHTCAEG